MVTPAIQTSKLIHFKMYRYFKALNQSIFEHEKQEQESQSRNFTV